MAIVLAVLLIICAVGWAQSAISVRTLIYYIYKKTEQFPNNDDLKECSAYVIKNIVRDLTKH